jgi:hypothetical protein
LNFLSRGIHVIAIRAFGLNEIHNPPSDNFRMVGRKNIRELPQHDADCGLLKIIRKKIDKRFARIFRNLSFCPEGRWSDMSGTDMVWSLQTVSHP